jgi:hypothetical protein
MDRAEVKPGNDHANSMTIYAGQNAGGEWNASE